MESVLEGMAEYYGIELAQKIRRGMQINAEKCLAVGGTKILGYKIQEKKYAIDQDEAPIVKKIFQMYIEDSKMAEIIRYLNNNGVKTVLGNDFNKSSIRRILTNKKYIGIYSYNGEETPGGVPRIIYDETFRQAQEILQKKQESSCESKSWKRALFANYKTILWMLWLAYDRSLWDIQK